MESRRLCAYNQTRECFLGLEVAAADLSLADLKNLFAKVGAKSGEGLWMAPFRGIPEMDMLAPLDLIYLDEDCRVIEVVESFPTFLYQSFEPAGRKRSGAANPLDLFVADPAGRSTGALCGRGDAAPAGAVLRLRQRCGRSAKRRSVEGQAALERRSRRGGTGGSLQGGTFQVRASV